MISDPWEKSSEDAIFQHYPCKCHVFLGVFTCFLPAKLQPPAKTMFQKLTSSSSPSNNSSLPHKLDVLSSFAFLFPQLQIADLASDFDAVDRAMDEATRYRVHSNP